MKGLSLEERKILLRDAMDEIGLALEKIGQATEGTSIEGRARGYPINNMKSWTRSGNQPGNIPDLINDLENLEEVD